MRLFIAVELPDGIRAGLAGLVATLRGKLPEVRWVRPEGIHLTLRFLGEVAREDVAGLAAQLKTHIPGALAPFEARVRGLGTFPETGRPRVIWVGVMPEPASTSLAVLQERVEQGVAAASLSRMAAETRPFRPHLTLGRWGEGRPSTGFREILEAMGPSDCGSFTISSAALMQSVTAPGGARYTRVEEFPL